MDNAYFVSCKRITSNSKKKNIRCFPDNVIELHPVNNIVLIFVAKSFDSTLLRTKSDFK